jgi:hypothetical protein
MKNIIDIYEGLLKGQDAHLSMSDDDVKALLTLGTHMRLHYVNNCTESSAAMFDARNLKLATKDLPYIDKNIERGQFDKRNKLKMFANWLSNLTLEELGLDDWNLTDDDFRQELTKQLSIKCSSNGLFTNPYYTNIWVSSTKVTGKDRIDFMISRFDKVSNGMKFIFDIIKH